jgi:hypothetical protein
VVSKVVDKDETVFTGSRGGATAADPLTTSVTVPVSGLVSIVEGAAGAGAPAGYSLLAAAIDITAPAAPDAQHPIELVFELAPGALPAGVDEHNVAILRNGVPVGPCGSGTREAVPTPCVFRRERVSGSNNVGLTLLTVEASRWMLAKPPQPSAPGQPPTEGGGGNEPPKDATVPPSGGPVRAPETPAGDVTAPRAGLSATRKQSLRTVLKRGVKVQVQCDEVCTVTIELRLDSPTARRLKLKNPVGRATKRFTAPGRKRTVLVRFTGKAAKALRRVRKVNVSTRVRAVDTAGNSMQISGPKVTLSR